MSSVNRIILARGPNGSNLDKIIDTKENVGAQNEMILDSNYDLSANMWGRAMNMLLNPLFYILLIFTNF